MNFKKCLLSFTALLLAMLLCLGGMTAVIDPFFHYHAPLPHLQYDIFYQREDVAPECFAQTPNGKESLYENS